MPAMAVEESVCMLLEILILRCLRLCFSDLFGDVFNFLTLQYRPFGQYLIYLEPLEEMLEVVLVRGKVRCSLAFALLRFLLKAMLKALLEGLGRICFKVVLGFKMATR